MLRRNKITFLTRFTNHYSFLKKKEDFQDSTKAHATAVSFTYTRGVDGVTAFVSVCVNNLLTGVWRRLLRPEDVSPVKCAYLCWTVQQEKRRNKSMKRLCEFINATWGWEQETKTGSKADRCYVKLQAPFSLCGCGFFRCSFTALWPHLSQHPSVILSFFPAHSLRYFLSQPTFSLCVLAACVCVCWRDDLLMPSVCARVLFSLYFQQLAIVFAAVILLSHSLHQKPGLCRGLNEYWFSLQCWILLGRKKKGWVCCTQWTEWAWRGERREHDD